MESNLLELTTSVFWAKCLRYRPKVLYPCQNRHFRESNKVRLIQSDYRIISKSVSQTVLIWELGKENKVWIWLGNAGCSWFPWPCWHLGGSLGDITFPSSREFDLKFERSSIASSTPGLKSLALNAVETTYLQEVETCNVQLHNFSLERQITILKNKSIYFQNRQRSLGQNLIIGIYGLICANCVLYGPWSRLSTKQTYSQCKLETS